MKRSHSFDEFCTEESLRVKKRKTSQEKKGGRKHHSGVTTSPSPDSQTKLSVCGTTNISQCNKDTPTRNIIAEAFAIAQETSSLENDTEASAQHELETAADVHVAQQKQHDCQTTEGSVNEADGSAQLLNQADILGVLQGLSSAYNLADVSQEKQPFQVVVNASSMYLVGPQNQVYLSMVPQQGEHVATPESQMLCTVEPITNQVSQQPLSDNLNYSQQFTSKSFSDKMKEKIEHWYYRTMDVDHREAHRLRFPSHLLEWSERVKIRHERKWKQLEYHAPDYSTFD